MNMFQNKKLFHSNDSTNTGCHESNENLLNRMLPNNLNNYGKEVKEQLGEGWVVNWPGGREWGRNTWAKLSSELTWKTGVRPQYLGKVEKWTDLEDGSEAAVVHGQGWVVNWPRGREWGRSTWARLNSEQTWRTGVRPQYLGRAYLWFHLQ